MIMLLFSVGDGDRGRRPEHQEALGGGEESQERSCRSAGGWACLVRLRASGDEGVEIDIVAWTGTEIESGGDREAEKRYEKDDS